MSKLPAFQFYPSDWRSDNGVQSLSYFERGVWFEILCLMHESEQRGKLLLNGKPMPDDALARLLGLDKQNLTKTLTTILDYGVATRLSDGTLVNRRMLRDEELRKIRTEAGKKGGNPILVNQNSSKTEKEVNQNSTPSSSSSSSSSNKKKRTTNVVPKNHTHFPIPRSDVQPDLWTAFLEMRFKLKKPLTQHGYDDLKNDLDKIKDFDLNKRLIKAIDRKWQGLIFNEDFEKQNGDTNGQHQKTFTDAGTRNAERIRNTNGFIEGLIAEADRLDALSSGDSDSYQENDIVIKPTAFIGDGLSGTS